MSQQQREPSASSSSSSSAEERELQKFSSDAEAEEARKKGLDLHKDCKFEEAEEIQAAVVAHFAEKHGDFHEKSSVAYLDYGLTLLAILQSRDNEAAALSALTGEAEEEFKMCFEILECARLGFTKQEKAKPDDESIAKNLIEVHWALGSLHEEADNEDEALKEYEAMLLLSRGQSTPNVRQVVSGIYSFAACHLRNAHYDEAMESFKEAIEMAKGTSIPADLVQEMEEKLQEAKELKQRGGIEDLKEEIRQQFPDEETLVADPQEVLEEKKQSNSFVTPVSLPAEFRGRGGLSSIPDSLTMPIPPRENSTSVSFIQPLGEITPGKPRPVNTAVVVRKKPKSQENSISIQHALNELSSKSLSATETGDAPAAKKQRLEK